GRGFMVPTWNSCTLSTNWAGVNPVHDRSSDVIQYTMTNPQVLPCCSVPGTTTYENGEVMPQHRRANLNAVTSAQLLFSRFALNESRMKSVWSLRSQIQPVQCIPSQDTPTMNRRPKQRWKYVLRDMVSGRVESPQSYTSWCLFHGVPPGNRRRLGPLNAKCAGAT